MMFGDRLASCVSDHTRGIVQGAYSQEGATYTKMAETFTIASTGVASHFGEMTVEKCGGRAGCQNMVRGLFAGGSPGTNVIDMITIQTTGNAQDFGDLSRSQHSLCGMCDSHGGLGGY